MTQLAQFEIMQRNAAEMHVPAVHEPGVVFHLLKRVFDIIGAMIGLALCGPVLLICAAWIKCIDRGPVLYRQWRVGHNGWLFRIYKLRTMRLNAEKPGDARWASRSDPRILPGCNWIRKSHLDELPQLLNILLGQMSLVGPRPERPEIINELRREIPRIERRHVARPGLTGLAQIRNGYTNDLAGARRKQAYDLLYLRSRSIWREVRLVFATIPKLWDRGAC